MALETEEQIQELETKYLGTTHHRTNLSYNIRQIDFPKEINHIKERFEAFTRKFEKPNGSQLRTDISNKILHKILKGWSYKEIGELLNVNYTTVKRLLDQVRTTHTFQELTDIHRKL